MVKRTGLQVFSTPRVENLPLELTLVCSNSFSLRRSSQGNEILMCSHVSCWSAMYKHNFSCICLSMVLFHSLLFFVSPASTTVFREKQNAHIFGVS